MEHLDLTIKDLEKALISIVKKDEKSQEIMELKKQLVIVLPMSEPLQKLNEVLSGIATDENIEISLIDDQRELTQFIGSSGQSLVAFSNAKKCATFLQENRFLVAKTHSKVILLTPKEIPAKTLMKFSKIGLTESILETSPPKTLLYKFKLLLRSIKGSSSEQEGKDQVVKSMLDTAPASAGPVAEINTARNQEETNANDTGKEFGKMKSGQEDISPDKEDNLKNKKAALEEFISTHWKSKRKKDEQVEFEDTSDINKIEVEDSSDIDMYYRAKKKSNSSQIIDFESERSSKKMTDISEDDDNDYLKKRPASTELNFENSRPEEKNTSYMAEDEDNYGNKLKSTNTSLLFDNENKPYENRGVNEEEEEERKRKELNELDALFEEAKKRQEAKEAVDLGGHYKGEINNSTLEFEDLTEDEEEKKEYDNSDLYEKKKSTEIELLEGEEEHGKRPFYETDEEDSKKKKSEQEKIDSLMMNQDGSTDYIDPLMMSDISEDASKQLRTLDIFEQDPNRNKDLFENSDSDKHKKNKYENDDEASSLLTKKSLDIEKEEEKEKNHGADSGFNIEDQAPGSLKKTSLEKDQQESDDNRASSTNLKLLDADPEENKTKTSDEDDSIGYKKIANTNLDLEKSSENRSAGGKVDKIETFYRSGEANKSNHNWDFLNQKNKNLDLGLEKRNRKEDEFLGRAPSKDAGEITIDYRKLKEEFESIARNGEAFGEDTPNGKRAGRSSEEEEDGSFKVVELSARGFDFGIDIVNLIYQKESKPVDFYQAISSELLSRYNAFPVFYTYKANEKKHIEVFDGFANQSEELRQWWLEFKKDEAIMGGSLSRTMSTWICRQMNWEDVELPSWAPQELTDKKVELVYPYFDGVDRMGVALVFFPNGLNPKLEKDIEVTLEMARTILLDSIQRTATTSERRDEAAGEEKTEKKKILNMFSGIFKGNKAG